MTIYEAVNSPVLARVPRSAQRILDIGCGAGNFGSVLKARATCTVIGITNSNEELGAAQRQLDAVHLADLNTFDPSGLGLFDCITLSHVLEHLIEPESLLKSLHGNLQPNGILIAALPNLLHWKQRFQLLRGRFRYTDGGVMDRTHLRFYDWDTAHQLLCNAQYTIVEAAAIGHLPMPILRRVLPQLVAGALDEAASKMRPGFFGDQFVFSCRSGKPCL